ISPSHPIADDDGEHLVLELDLRGCLRGDPRNEDCTEGQFRYQSRKKFHRQSISSKRSDFLALRSIDSLRSARPGRQPAPGDDAGIVSLQALGSAMEALQHSLILAYIALVVGPAPIARIDHVAKHR